MSSLSDKTVRRSAHGYTRQDTECPLFTVYYFGKICQVFPVKSAIQQIIIAQMGSETIPISEPILL